MKEGINNGIETVNILIESQWNLNDCTRSKSQGR